MFTGIVEERGTVVDRGSRFVVAAPKIAQGSLPGDSIAVNGVCLTVVAQDGDRLSFDLSPETNDRTSLAKVAPGDPVNLEADMIAKYLDGLMRTSAHGRERST